MRPAAVLRGLRLLLRRLAREERASAALEAVIGTVAVLGLSMLAFDLYSLTRANAASARTAATMADYVSRDAARDGDEIAALGRFLHGREFAMPVALVYVISAVRQPADDDPAEHLWDDDTVRIGGDAATTALVQECRRRGEEGWRAILLGSGGGGGDEDAGERLALPAGDAAIVVEVCASPLREGMLTSRFVTGTIYRLHALPTRDTNKQPPVQPSYSSPDEAAA